MTDQTLPQPVKPPPLMRVFGVLLFASAISALFFYKWGSAFRALQKVGVTGKLGVAPEVILEGGALVSAWHYFARIWPALTYGVVIGAIVRSTVPPSWIAAVLGRRGAKPTVAGAICGSPLMLCSCCVTPIFTGVYERGARLGSALALMLASPGLNVAALILTFALMPLHQAVERALAAAIIVFALAPAIGALLEKTVPAGKRLRAAATDETPATWKEFAAKLAKNLVYMVGVTLPMIVVGVLLSALLLPHTTRLSALGGVFGVALVALVATLVALPTFFELPIALLLLGAGAPASAAIAVLVAGPIVNLPSLFVLARETNARVAVALGAGVWVVASIAGVLAS